MFFFNQQTGRIVILKPSATFFCHNFVTTPLFRFFLTSTFDIMPSYGQLLTEKLVKLKINSMLVTNQMWRSSESACEKETKQWCGIQNCDKVLQFANLQYKSESAKCTQTRARGLAAYKTKIQHLTKDLFVWHPWLCYLFAKCMFSTQNIIKCSVRQQVL